MRRSGGATLLLHSGPRSLRLRSIRLEGWAASLPLFAPPHFAPMPYEAAAALRQQYTGGSEYFLLRRGGEAAMREVLSGFSAFKRRLRSGLQLVMLGAIAPALQKDLESYRYRSDLHFFPEAEAGRFTAAAYAVLLPSGAPAHLALEPLKCGIPLLTPPAPEIQSVCGTAPLYVETPEDWGPALQRIYSDEGVWSACAGKGEAAAARHPFSAAADALEERITFAAKTKTA